jgi:class 3 adenylate cyclase
MTEHPDLKKLNRTFIGSVLFIDIVGYSTHTVQEQAELREVFNNFFNEVMKSFAEAERIVVDTGDGAAVAFLGDPEDALFAALSLRDAFDAAHLTVGEPGFARMGINLGPLKIVRDINGHTNMIGDGVNDAHRVMSFATPGQLMVSHSYYDIISRFSRDYAQLFSYDGTRHDKHVREHEVYSFGSSVGVHEIAEKLRDLTRARAGHAYEEKEAASAKATATQEAAAAKLHKTRSHTGMIAAAAVGALAIVGAVWSWTSKPSIKPPAADLPAPAADAVSAAASTTASTSAPPSNSAQAAASEAASAPQQVALASSPPPKSSASSASASAKEAPGERTSAKAGSAKASPSASGDASTDSSSAPKPGVVKLAIAPWGEIVVDGKKRGVSPPMKSLKLDPGKHQIEAHNGKFAPCTHTIDVKSGAETVVKCKF